VIETGKLEQKWRDVATLFYVQRRWLHQLSGVTQQLRDATSPSSPKPEVLPRLVADLESLAEKLDANAEEILGVLGG